LKPTSEINGMSILAMVYVLTVSKTRWINWSNIKRRVIHINSRLSYNGPPIRQIPSKSWPSSSIQEIKPEKIESTSKASISSCSW